MLFHNGKRRKNMKTQTIDIEDLKIERKVAIYVRESSKFQANEGYNIHLQEQVCKNYIDISKEVENIDDVLIYREKGFSAKTIQRPVLNDLIRDVKKGKIKTIVVQKLDRLARREVGMWKLLDMFEKYDVKLIALRENVDSSNPMCRIAFAFHTLLAEMEQKQISERTGEALTFGASLGSYVKGGKAPFGTVREKVYKEDGSHIITLKQHPKHWEILKKIFDLSYHGANCTAISIIIMKECKIGLNEDSIEKILSNKIYCGIQTLKGKEYEVDFNGCFTREYWEQVQINRRIHLSRDTKHDYKYHGKVHCECGTLCVIDVSKKKLADGTIKYYKYYVCPHCGKRISETVIYQTVESEIEEYFKEHVSEYHHTKQKLRLKKIESRNTMLYELFMDDKLPMDEYKKELIKAQEQKERIERNMERGKKKYDKLTEEERKAFIDENIKSIVVHNKKSIEVTYNA